MKYSSLPMVGTLGLVFILAVLWMLSSSRDRGC